MILAGALLLVATTPALASPPSPLSSARAAFQDGRFGEAVVFAEEALAEVAVPADRATARHLMGRALIELGLWAQAAEVLDAALDAAAQDQTLLSDHLRWLLAQALGELGRYADQADAYGVLRQDEQSPFAARAGYHEALAWEAAGDIERARRTLQRFVQRRPDSPLAREGQIRLATWEAARGNEAQALRLYDQVTRFAPGSAVAIQQESDSAQDLELLPGAQDPPSLDDLEWLVTERRFTEARGPLEAMAEAAAAKRDRSRELRALELLARVLRETGELEAALELYGALEKRGSRPTSHKRLSYMWARVGDHKKAERHVLLDHGKRKGRAYWSDLGDLRLEHGRYPEAERAYRKAKGKRRDAWLTRRIAWTVMRQGKTEKALKLLDSVASLNRSKRLYARYWKARTLQDAGRLDEALDGFRSLLQDAPLDYYGIQAWSRIADITDEAPEQTGAVAGSLMACAAQGSAAVVAWARDQLPASTVHWPNDVLTTAWEAAPVADDLEARVAALHTFAEDFGDVAPEAWRALELARLGLVDEAAAELRVIDTDLRVLRWRGWRALIDRSRSDLLDNRRTKKSRGGGHIHTLGRRTKKAAKRFGEAAREGLRRGLRVAQVALADPYALRRSVLETSGIRGQPSEASLANWRKAYPLAYADLVARFSPEAGVPPYLLYGVMTVESTFHPHAVSVSNAYGLLQVIPRTGRRVAAELGFVEFSPEMLLRPEVAIYMGSYYFGRVLARFSGQEPLAAAAYNAGPHRVASWLRSNADRPMDVFIEEIPFRQARRYTRKVLMHTARYRRVYHGEEGMYVSNRLDGAHGPTPNY